MKKIIRFSWINVLVGVALSAILFSFSSLSGAHSFQVYLDSKLMIDQYVNSKMVAPTVLVDPAEDHSQLIVKYNECGRTVTSRTMTIKDESDKVLKDWRFEGVTSGYKDPMPLPIKEITALKKNGSKTLKLYYSSKEFPEGQQVANLVIGSKATTALKQ
jgi:hypothetical protein